MSGNKRINWREAGVYAAAAGLTLIEPRRLRGWQKWAYWGGVSALAGAAAVEGERSAELGWYAYVPLTGDVHAPANPTTFLTAAGITFGLREPSLALDAWFADKLRDWGCKRPRVLMALLTGVAGVGAVALSATAPRLDLPEDEGLGETRDLEPRVRQVVAEMLARTDDWGAKELRRQFASADQTGTHADGFVLLGSDDEAPRSPVPYYEFPVIGHGVVDDEPVTIRLRIEDGRIATLECRTDEHDFRPIPDDVHYTVGEDEQVAR